MRRLERIEISNFKAIRHLTLDFPASTDRESWLMFVGENATGKSSILQAVGLALLGQSHVHKLGLDARTFVHHGERRGHVRTFLTNVSQPVTLQFIRSSPYFRLTPPKELVLLLGYGATRLLPRSSKFEHDVERYIRVKNLFNPYARLQHAEKWLADRPRVSDDRFHPTALALKQLLLLSDEDLITRHRGKVTIRFGGDPTSQFAHDHECLWHHISEGQRTTAPQRKSHNKTSSEGPIGP